METERVRRFIVALSEEEYQRLAAEAMRDVREPPQQAAYYIKRVLSGSNQQTQTLVTQ